MTGTTESGKKTTEKRSNENLSEVSRKGSQHTHDNNHREKEKQK